MYKSLAILLLLAFQSAGADTLSGRVVGVADGDTLTVLDQSHAVGAPLRSLSATGERAGVRMGAHKIRLSGIDAPERAQPFGQVSKQSLSGLTYGRAVSVEWHKRDRYRRIIGQVFAGGRDVNLAQVRRGLAWHYKHYQNEQTISDRARYVTAETEARAARRALWGDPKPIPPWIWRARRIKLR